MLTVLKNLLHILLIPVYIVVILLFLTIWGVFTFTGIGPILQYCFSLSDKKKLDRDALAIQHPSDIKIIKIPGGINKCSEGKSYNVFAVYSEPTAPSQYPPVCIPNGLGATAVLISQMQEALVDHGFAVLSFDRLGVGLSDENTSGIAPTASDIVKEMNFVMNYVQPSDKKWILLGPSMGSIVAQCYMSVYPDKVEGFLNMDGLPYPFLKFNNSFMWAAFIYRIYASFVWTGILRPFIGMALKSNDKMFACRLFPLSIAIAQMNQRRFFANVAYEMSSMMDCCEMTAVAWGKQNILKLKKSDLEILVQVPPTVSIDFDEHTGIRAVTIVRSKSEAGSDWATTNQVTHISHHLRHPSSQTHIAGGENPLQSTATEAAAEEGGGTEGVSVLGNVWSQLIVRVMSGRNHDFGNVMANSFYNQEMRNYAAAEHAKHALLALDGKRTNYPKLTHTVMFTKTDDIVRNVLEIGQALVQLRSSSTSFVPTATNATNAAATVPAIAGN